MMEFLRALAPTHAATARTCAVPVLQSRFADSWPLTRLPAVHVETPAQSALADTRERLDWLRMARARGRYLGMHMDVISVAEAKQLNPLLEERFFVGALYDPDEGSVDPYGVTHAYAICARNRGAEVYTDTWVTGLAQRPDGTWEMGKLQYWDTYVRVDGGWCFQRRRFLRWYICDALTRPSVGAGIGVDPLSTARLPESFGELAGFWDTAGSTAP